MAAASLGVQLSVWLKHMSYSVRAQLLAATCFKVLPTSPAAVNGGMVLTKHLPYSAQAQLLAACQVELAAKYCQPHLLCS
jgi:hypothetical protein